MKESLKFLNRISKIKGLELENYYAIGIYPACVQLQGIGKQDLREQLEKFMPIPEISIRENVFYTEFKRGKLEVVLTNRQ